MTTISNDLLLNQLNWRYATKSFDSTRKIPVQDWETLEKALVLTPSSYGLQPWKFFVITGDDLKGSLQIHSWNQGQVSECSHFVVFAIKKNIGRGHALDFVESMAKTRNIPLEGLDFYRDMILRDIIDGPRSLTVNEWATRQTYIALGNFMTCAAMVGIDTCPMEGIEPAKYDEILGLPAKGYATVVACAAGYRSPADKYATLPKVRYPASEIIEHI